MKPKRGLKEVRKKARLLDLSKEKVAWLLTYRNKKPHKMRGFLLFFFFLIYFDTGVERSGRNNKTSEW
ncbi:MAG: hypothetical protein CM1200mP10_25740 [Candidatus Neomarinimicrobiota bacterium]|nr:MAG: hypothetical protein CM1200mP10_25740 [Candidatus Neomarinimicrobiota bacterium]